jgi:hypothetical protein
MDNKALGIKILKSTALFTGKAAWFLLCKACLAVLLIIGFIVDTMASEQQGQQSEADRNPLSDIEFDDPQSPHFLQEKPRSF